MVAPTHERLIAEIGKARISKSGQITIPAEIRRELGLEAGDTVIYGRNKDGHITIRKPRTAAELTGSFGPRPEGVDLDDIIRESTHEGIERRVNRWLK